MSDQNSVTSMDDYMSKKLREFMLKSIHDPIIQHQLADFLVKRFPIELEEVVINPSMEIAESLRYQGDEFIQLNIAIDAYLPERDGKDNTGIYIQCAKQLKEKIKPDGDTWNTASQAQLQKRYDIEKRLVDLLRLGVVQNFEHLKALIDKV